MTFGAVNCEKCNNKIYPKDNKSEVKCSGCGAYYTLVSDVLDSLENGVAYFEFAGYRCMHKGLSSLRDKGSLYKECQNSCPNPNMYCEDHCGEEEIENAESSVGYATKRLKDAEFTLERLEESRKIWLIQDLSGIDEEDDTLPED